MVGEPLPPAPLQSGFHFRHRTFSIGLLTFSRISPLPRPSPLSMPQITFRDRLRYQFDNTMARGPVALIAWLGVVSLLLILFISAVVVATDRVVVVLAWTSLVGTAPLGTHPARSNRTARSRMAIEPRVKRCRERRCQSVGQIGRP